MIPPIESTQLALVVKEPIGVVGRIVPWNYPLLLLAWKLAPALAAGNTVVAKPSELTPLSTLMLAACFDHLPPGVVNIAGRRGRRGRGDRGRRARRLRGVHRLGRDRQEGRGRACAERVARMNLEMGGKDPFIVCADVAGDVDVAARGGAWAAYLNAGQVCTSAERFYVAREVYDDFVSAFVDHTRLAAGRAIRSTPPRTWARWCRRRSARRWRRRSRPPSPPAPRCVVGGDRAGQERGTSSRPPW